MPDLSLRRNPFHGDLRSKIINDDFTDIENYINDLQSQIDLLTTTPGGTEVTNARDNFSVLRDRLRSGFKGLRNQLITGGVVSQQGTPNMTVAISAGEAIIAGIGCSWSGQNSGTITAPTNKRYDVVVINSDNSISIEAGNDSNDPVLPDISDTQLPVAIIRLLSSTTSITTALIETVENQGCLYWKGNKIKYTWKIQDAVDDATTGDIYIGRGKYYEEVDLTGLSNITLIYENGSKHYRPDATKRCIKSINTAGNEESYIRIIGGDFYGNSKSGAIENIRFEYTDRVFFQNIFSDSNASSSATYKDLYLLNCDYYLILDSFYTSNGYTGSSKLLNEAESKRTVISLSGVPTQVGDNRVWPTIDYDNRSLYNGTTGRIDLPFTGWYKIRFIERMRFNSGAGRVIVLVNGIDEVSASGGTDGRTVLVSQTELDQGADYEYYIGEIIIYQTAGDYIGIGRTNASPDNDGLIIGSLYLEYMQNMDPYWDN